MYDNPFDCYTEDYENWFKENNTVFQSERLALQEVIPIGKKGVEIGIGSGIFAEKLGIKYGVDPSEKMLFYAQKRQLNVVKGVAENLPYLDKSFDFAVFITSLCFVDNPKKALKEASRILKDKGDLIIAFIDKESFLGRFLLAKKEKSRFYRTANFYSVNEILSLVKSNHFEVDQILQTLTDLDKKEIETPSEGYGIGGFVVIKASKKESS